jgi:DNA-binding transcriptional LysR family regulator
MLDLSVRLHQFQSYKVGLKLAGTLRGGSASVITHFDFVDLRLFIHIAEENSLTRGAERVHMSLPAASTRIKNLEEVLGAKLLYRASNGVTLTPPGQVLLQHALDVQRQMEHLCADLQEYSRGVKGNVRLFANTTAITEFLPAVLSRFLSKHRNVNVDLRERLSSGIVRAVIDGAADVGIIAGNVRTEGLEVLPYREDRLILVCARSHALGQRREASFDETLEFDHVCLPEASAIYSFLMEAADRAHRRLNFRIQVGNFDAMCRMVAANVGIGILPESAARRQAKTNDIHLVHLTDKWALRDLKICVRSLDLLPGFARDLVKLIVDDAREASKTKSIAAVA